MFVRHFLVRGGSVEDPDISPLKAQLHGLPRALFSIGTRDCLLDDSLFMAARWMAAGSPAELAVYPGGAHVFQSFPSALSEQSLARMDAFLMDLAGCAV
jgi:acetyl esterase/lipase